MSDPADLVRAPSAAGTFYPSSPAVLTAMLASLVAAAGERIGVSPETAPKALLVPHAGYVYSGAIAALAYATLARSPAIAVCRVVVLGPSHYLALRGLALSGARAFCTPLGLAPVERTDDEEWLGGLPQVVVEPAAHAQEHSLEVHVPFLQTVLDDFTLLPIAVGHASAQEVADVLDAVWGNADTLIVVSSDLSHYLPYRQARRVDRATIQQVLALDGTVTHEQACGATPLNGLLVSAARHELEPQLLGSCNSGDTAGDKRRVVGYAAVAFREASHGE